MREKNRIEQLVTLCWSCEDRTEQVRAFLQQNPLSGEALTRAALL